MHTLKLRTRRSLSFVSPRTTRESRLQLSENQIAALQIVSVGLMAGLCCFVGSWTVLVAMQLSA